MISNLDRYRKDLDALLTKGERLSIAMRSDLGQEGFKAVMEKRYGDDSARILKELPDFLSEYQGWYSEASALIKQMLPDRYSDFVRHYAKPPGRKNIDFENYRIEDALQGLTTSREKQVWEGTGRLTIAEPCHAIPHFKQQLAILKAVTARFESSLFDIQQLVQADLFDSEIDAARELAKHKFLRAAGAVAGVVLEKHLHQVCRNHNVTIKKKNVTISDLNDLLKAEGVIELPDWRRIQLLGDIRNLCDHDKKAEPTDQQIKELLDGIATVTKTIF